MKHYSRFRFRFRHCKFIYFLKSDFLFQIIFNLLQWQSFKNDKKNAFYFILKALFVEDSQVLSWLFGHVEKRAWLKR